MCIKIFNHALARIYSFAQRSPLNFFCIIPFDLEDVAVAMSQSLTLDLMIFAGWPLVAALVIKKASFPGSSLGL
jgi:hypothetical protein